MQLKCADSRSFNMSFSYLLPYSMHNGVNICGIFRFERDSSEGFGLANVEYTISIQMRIEKFRQIIVE